MRVWIFLVVLCGCGKSGIGDEARAPDAGIVDGGTPVDAGDGVVPRLELIAGDIGGLGNVDGVGAQARFFAPQALVVDGSGVVYVADTGNATIRRISPDGTVTTFAGAAGQVGSVDATGSAARFTSPSGIAIDSAGNLYVTDNDTVRKITPAGAVSTLAGSAGKSGSVNGKGAAARFSFPSGIGVDSAGNLYVADSGNDTIREITATGTVTTLAGTPGAFDTVDGTGPAAHFFHPEALTVDGDGNVYVLDIDKIRKITSGGVVTTLSLAFGALFASRGIAVDRTGNFYVANDGDQNIRKVTPAGEVTTIAGAKDVAGSADGTGSVARFNAPSGIAIDPSGNVYVADSNNDNIRKISPARVVTTLAGRARLYGSADGPRSKARFDEPGGIVVDRAGNMYVTDFGNSTVRKIAVHGEVTTFAGVAGEQASADGVGANARFLTPSDLTIDLDDNMYVVDAFDDTVRKIAADGTVTTLAGSSGAEGSADGVGSAARFWLPLGISVDRARNLYVADGVNDTIRKISADGTVTTLAGDPGTFGSADGVGTAARFEDPASVAVDGAGNVYVADPFNNTIRKVTPDGTVTTLAGLAGQAGRADGAGKAARFDHPLGVAVDVNGNVYVADAGNSIIRKITPDGMVSTIAGTPGVSGVLPGDQPRFAYPSYLTVVGDSLAITDLNAILVLHGAVQ